MLKYILMCVPFVSFVGYTAYKDERVAATLIGFLMGGLFIAGITGILKKLEVV